MNKLAITANDHNVATQQLATPLAKKIEPIAAIDIKELFTEPEIVVTQDVTKKNPITDFIENFVATKLVKYTTISSALVNIISAPVRMFDDTNPLKKIINNISMLFTKGHLLTYATAGMDSAIKQRNPFLVFSFAVEGIAALLKLRGIYLFRGIATGIDGAVSAIKDRFKKVQYKTFSEGFFHNIEAVKQMGQEVLTQPKRIFEGAHMATFASLTAAVGAVIGMTIQEQVGGFIRDTFGGIGDLGIFKFNHPLARQSGFLYLGGTILDLSARVFNKGLAAMLGVKNVGAFEKLRDAFHECAIAFDRWGQYFFLRYNQESDLTKQRQEDLGTRLKAALSY